MANTGWRFLLCNNDSTLSQIGELTHAQGKQLELLLNRPGSLKFQINGGDWVAQQIAENLTCVKAYRDNICRWSGPIWNVTDSLPDKMMEVSAVGWGEELNYRIVEDFDPRLPAPTPLVPQHMRAKYDTIDAGLIAYGLLGLANEQRTDSGVLAPTHIVAGTRDPSITRKRNYDKFQNIGAGIQELSDIESGFDYSIGPERIGGGNPLNIHYQLIQAGYYGKGALRTNATFSIGWGQNNLRSFTRVTDVSQMRNRIVTSGRFGAWRAGNVASQAAHGIFEENISLSNIVDPTIVQAFAVAEVALRSKPRVIYSMTPFPWTAHPTNNVPRLFDDYDIGDMVVVTAQGGRVNVELQLARVFGVVIDINENGTENISTLHTAPFA